MTPELFKEICQLEKDLRIAKASGAPEDYIDMIRGEICSKYKAAVL